MLIGDSAADPIVGATRDWDIDQIYGSYANWI